MKRRLGIHSLLIALATLGFFTACSSSSYDSVTEDDLANGSGAYGANGTGGGYGESDLDYARDSRFGDGRVPTAEGGGIFKDIKFNYDSATLNSQQRQNIEYNAQILEQNPQVKVQLEGHCDERGTNEYNLALGEQRARSVREVLMAYGVSPQRIETISYGEELPLANGQSEGAWAQNRRVHFSGYTTRK